MCIELAFGKTPEQRAREALQTLAHEDVSCAGSWLFVGRLVSGELAALSSPPIAGAAVVAFPKLPRHELTPCPTSPCVLGNLRGMLRPAGYVWVDNDFDGYGDVYGGAVYRSLAPPLAVPRLRPLEGGRNPDGGVSATVPVAPYVRADMDQATRHALSQPMLDCVLEGLHKHDIPRERLFGDDDYATSAPDASTPERAELIAAIASSFSFFSLAYMASYCAFICR